MSIYHCAIKIISRAGGRSAIAAAAYRSGEKLHDEETGLTHDYTRKGGVIFSEILLSENAPADYLDREKLWNEVQKIEARSDARLAREIEVALPKEMTREEQIEAVRSYINENFVGNGMIADWALHDKRTGNPHAHIMLTCRAFTPEHTWDIKTKSVFANDRDENGKAVFDPNKPVYDPSDKEHTAQYRIPQLDRNGEQKFRERPGKGKEMLWERVNIPANDWNSKANAEIWREAWAETCNRYLTQENKIDHRSFERQGIDRMPTIHEGATARKMEAVGKISDRMEINREIRKINALKRQIKKIADFLKPVVDKLVSATKSLAEKLETLRFSIIRHRMKIKEAAVAKGKADEGIRESESYIHSMSPGLEEQLDELKKERKLLKRQIDGMTGLFTKKKKNELQARIEALDNSIRFQTESKTYIDEAAKKVEKLKKDSDQAEQQLKILKTTCSSEIDEYRRTEAQISTEDREQVRKERLEIRAELEKTVDRKEKLRFGLEAGKVDKELGCTVNDLSDRMVEHKRRVKRTLD